ncbi:MAG: GYD domain-containing protein [Methanobacteriota archaeon]|nr:MAG: GYD domain-containing protein [Euryarchaeota archaeon]
MPKYIILGQWTDQGIRTVKDTAKRADAVKALAAKMGAKLDVWWTMGAYDFVAMAEAPNDETYMQLALQIGTQGNVRTTSLKAWSQDEAVKVISKLQ